jgi:hypothetical protein
MKKAPGVLPCFDPKAFLSYTYSSHTPIVYSSTDKLVKFLDSFLSGIIPKEQVTDNRDCYIQIHLVNSQENFI